MCMEHKRVISASIVCCLHEGVDGGVATGWWQRVN